jgi:uncharacterized protein YdaU (DUF1376 family)
VSFYKMDPAAWDFGTAALSLEEEAAYLRIVNAMHKHEGPVPNIDRVLAGMFRCSTRKARALVDALEKAGKVTIQDGKIWNDRARSDLVQRGFTSISRAESGAKGGRSRAERAANSLKENEANQASASSREEKRREEYSDANASGGEPPPKASEPVDFTKEVFDRGVAFLGKYGTPERQARALIGKWRKDAGDGETFNALRDANREGVTEPVGWITARLTKIRAGPRDADLSAVFAKIQGEMQ